MMPNEVSVHAQEYGFAEMFFDDEEEEEEEDDSNNFTDDDDTNLPVRRERDLGAGDGWSKSPLRPAA